MPFKPDKNQPDLASLFTTLANSKLQTTNPALYQTIFNLIQRGQQSKGLFVEDINRINNSINNILSQLNLIINNPPPTPVTSGGGVLPMVTGAEPPQLMSSGDGNLIIIPYDSDHP